MRGPRGAEAGHEPQRGGYACMRGAWARAIVELFGRLQYFVIIFGVSCGPAHVADFFRMASGEGRCVMREVRGA